MLVFGDHRHLVRVSERIDSIRSALDSAHRTTRDRHLDTAVSVLVQTGELAQAVLDARFVTRGCDDRGNVEQACHGAVFQAARWLLGADDGQDLVAALRTLAALELPSEVSSSVPEGFTFYAVHPLLYAGAARDWRSTDDRPFVAVGLRSIGTSLAAVVAAAGGAAHAPVTLRPVGPPFRREVKLSDALANWLLAKPEETVFALVDDGPGLSGSSFGAVADWFEAHGVGPERLVFFPSHANDLGPEASDSHRRRWSRARRFVRPLESLGSEVFRWDATEPEHVEELSAGLWRRRFWADEQAWPPSNRWMERRKYLGTGRRGQWLAKFVGYGRIGERIATRSRLLAEAGFTPRGHDLRGGFLTVEWLHEVRPLWPVPVDGRDAVIDHLARYIAFRSRSLPLDSGERGARPSELLEMMRRNVGLALCDDPTVMERWTDLLGEIERDVRPVCSDNRMHPWEWLRLPDGRLLKADAADHHASHELVGPQDPWWDVAGAIVEFELDAREEARLTLRLIDDGVLTDSRVLRDFFVQSYLAFQIGAWTLAADSLEGVEAARCREAARRAAARFTQERGGSRLAGPGASGFEGRHRGAAPDER